MFIEVTKIGISVSIMININQIVKIEALTEKVEKDGQDWYTTRIDLINGEFLLVRETHRGIRDKIKDSGGNVA